MTYLEKKKRGDALEEEKSRIVFGLAGGVLLMLAGALNWLNCEPGPWEIVCVCVFALGAILALLAVVVPAFLKYPYIAFRFWGNLVGKVIFAAVLAVIYCLLVFPAGLLVRRKRGAQGYAVWDQTQQQPRSMFTDTAGTDGFSRQARASYLGILLRLISGFAANGKYVLIPAVIVLVIVGLILFFVSSNVATAFIYTLF